ncbi:hypothetical protein DUNSADRAFT_6088 [Dunaliella salina]|uniref:Uncharacterized protein n=1 Tax=Dunaliella salina TaxID=3046 RepID=A0ABQ7H6Y4_DUNSA|nr:hypothetical protein DUNSADRAFT_6088 [Dunaliella salina]|eukprot:KAF5842618.1 hypothetical protein DUNSADRAFT_6088 [Dunaliella salina]
MPSNKCRLCTRARRKQLRRTRTTCSVSAQGTSNGQGMYLQLPAPYFGNLTHAAIHNVTIGQGAYCTQGLTSWCARCTQGLPTSCVPTVLKNLSASVATALKDCPASVATALTDCPASVPAALKDCPASVLAALKDCPARLPTGFKDCQHTGWGRVSLKGLKLNGSDFDPNWGLQVIQKASHNTEKQKHVYTIQATALGPLIVTMAYMDYPASPNVRPLLVNDLNLKVVGPSG